MFKINIIPRFGDIDGLKHVNNTVLAIWFEKGRNPIFRMFTPDLDLSYEKWKLILVRTEFDFIGQMYYGKDVEIRSYITHIGNSSFTIGHEAWQDEELKAKGKAILVHYDFIDQVPLVIPDTTKAELEANFVKEEDIGKK